MCFGSLHRCIWSHNESHDFGNKNCKLEELGLKKNKVEPCIFASEQLIVMHHLDTLLIVGDKPQQESFISQLSSHVSLNNTTKLDAKTPLSFLNKTLEYSQQDHSISLHLAPSIFLHEAFQDVWHDQSKSNKHNR